MPLTLTERMILFNQYKILEKIDSEQAEFYASACEILESGYECEYEDLAEHFLEPLTVDQGKEVADILDMYRAIGDAAEKFNDTGAASSVNFRGFDGNNEGSQFRYVGFLRKQDRWSDVLKGDLNSHLAMLPRYRRMLERWRESADIHELTSADLSRIVTG